ncbi:hypothetical protein D3C72_1499460 [compost metagenome]
MEALHVGQVGDLVADEIVEPDARQPCVDLVVDPRVAAIVVAVLVRGMHVVRVADGVQHVAVGTRAHHALGFIGDAPAGQRIGHEARNAMQLAPRGQAQHAHVARMAAAPQAVVGIELARLQVHRRTRMRAAMSCVGTASRSGRGGCPALVRARRHAGQSGQRCGVDKAPSSRCRRCIGVCQWVLRMPRHLRSSNRHCKGRRSPPAFFVVLVACW